MALDPGKFTVSRLAGELDGLSREELMAARELEVAGKDRVTALEAIDEALEALPAEAPAEPPAPAPAPAKEPGVVLYYCDARGWFAVGDDVPPDFGDLRFGTEAYCRGALLARR
tara:strand:+ start:4142 stop:4483 length:342 start_codon:yes stop_codon:yes gene_type:complete